MKGRHTRHDRRRRGLPAALVALSAVLLVGPLAPAGRGGTNALPAASTVRVDYGVGRQVVGTTLEGRIPMSYTLVLGRPDQAACWTQDYSAEGSGAYHRAGEAPRGESVWQYVRGGELVSTTVDVLSCDTRLVRQLDVSETTYLLDDTSGAFRSDGNWAWTTAAGAFGGRVWSSAVAGAVLTWPDSTWSDFALVAATPSSGSVRVLVDGVARATVTLGSAPATIAYAFPRGAPATHRVAFRVVSGTVQVDAVATR